MEKFGYLFSFSLTHSSIHSFMHVFPYSFQKHVLLASDLSPDLDLPLSRVAFGVGGVRLGHDCRIPGTHP